MDELPHHHVVLLHGLGRTSVSMLRLARRLRREGFRAAATGYPSRRRRIEELAEHVRARLPEPPAGGSLHFVTHSMGGIVLRQMLAAGRPAGLGRAVMLAPPNAGSRLAGRLEGRNPVALWLGPALPQLAHGGDCLPLRLGPPGLELGVIMGNRTIPGMHLLFDVPNDGILKVEEGRVDGMTDFLVVPRGHTFIMNSRAVARQVVHFLRHGRFDHDG